MKVIWSNLAEAKLKTIYHYYQTQVSGSVAESIVESLIEGSLILANFPGVGQVEPMLEGMHPQCRYLLKGHYKLIYWVTDFVYIATIFDTRQDPSKLVEEIG